ncbi:MAG: hypothetical protein ABI680_20140 [Chthoniobacteraceae bacterium]
MMEVFSEAIRLVNLPFTLLLGLVVFYWFLVALGMLDIHLFSDVGHDLHTDGDMDMDAHADAHTETETDHDGGAVHAGAWWADALTFVNVGQVPVMVVFSVLSLCLWLGAMIGSFYFSKGSALISLALLLPNFIFAAVLTRYLTKPLKPLFKMLTRDYDEKVEIIGSQCKVISFSANAAGGQAEVQTSGAPIVLNVRTLDDAVLPKGATAVVVREDKEHGLHFIAPLPDTTQTQP